MRSVVLDCDPGHDDAFAIMLAAKHMNVIGITTVGGNQLLERVTTNALKVLEVTGMTHIPVYPGHSRPMVCDLVTAPQFHGESGMDGPVLPDPTIKPSDKHAVNFIIDTVMSTDDITLIATGPLTNIAAAINREPRVINRVREISLMGGSVTFGNWTPTAEFNIFVDPEAAFRVFNSGIHVKMCGLNLTRQAFVTKKELDRINEIGNKVSRFCVGLLEFFSESSRKSAGLSGAILHDPCAVAWLIDPTLIKAVDMHVTVELRGEFTRGMTVCDYRHLRGPEPSIDLYRTPTMSHRGKKPNCEAALELDVERFFRLLYETIETYP
jgi:pyrimidine-specific ribonucleoside hydrolase